jgi:hypothetical protein
MSTPGKPQGDVGGHLESAWGRLPRPNDRQTWVFGLDPALSEDERRGLTAAPQETRLVG